MGLRGYYLRPTKKGTDVHISITTDRILGEPWEASLTNISAFSKESAKAPTDQTIIKVGNLSALQTVQETQVRIDIPLPSGLYVTIDADNADNPFLAKAKELIASGLKSKEVAPTLPQETIYSRDFIQFTTPKNISFYRYLSIDRDSPQESIIGEEGPNVSHLYGNTSISSFDYDPTKINKFGTGANAFIDAYIQSIQATSLTSYKTVWYRWMSNKNGFPILHLKFSSSDGKEEINNFLIFTLIDTKRAGIFSMLYVQSPIQPTYTTGLKAMEDLMTQATITGKFPYELPTNHSSEFTEWKEPSDK